MEPGRERVDHEEHVEGTDAFGQRPGVAASEIQARCARRCAAHRLQTCDLRHP